MVTLVIYISLLITPFIMAFSHCSILYKKHYSHIYADYFIVFDISLYMVMNAFAYLFNGEYISSFQSWQFTPAITQLGILYLTISIISIISLFKDKSFKSCFLIFYSIYLILHSFTLFSGKAIDSHILGLYIVDIIKSLTCYLLYKYLK